MMTKHEMALMAGLALLAGPLAGIAPCHAVELTVSRQALERTLKQQLFSGPGGRYYLKGNAHSACFISTEDPHLSFEQGRIVVRVKTVARLGTPVGGTCLGMSLSLPAQVSLAPDAEGGDDWVPGRATGQDFGPERDQLCAVAVPARAGAEKHEGECDRIAAQGAGGLDGLLGIQGEPGPAEDSLRSD